MKQIFFAILFIVHLALLTHKVSAQTKMAWYCQPCGSSCDTIVFTAAGKCPHCGMDLVKQSVAEHDKAKMEKKYKIAFYLQDGVEVLDFAGPMEVFVDAGFEVFTVSKTKAPIKSQGVLTIMPDYGIDNAPHADILAFFGGNSGNASNDADVINWVKGQTTPLHYFSVCTGAFILGKAGFLDNLTVTTFHESIDGLQKAVPKAKVLANVRFVDNGRVITTAGISAGIDGALHLVAKLRGQAAAIAVAKYMEYDKWIPNQGLVMGGK